MAGLDAIHSLKDGTVLHADIQAKQFLVDPGIVDEDGGGGGRSVSVGGGVKLNDFNRCRLVSVVQHQKKKVEVDEDKTIIGATKRTITTTKMTKSKLVREQQHQQPKSTTYNNTSCTVRIPSAPGTSRSPEEYAKTTLTSKADLYSAANILFAILVGKKPWGDDTLPTIIKTRIEKGEIPDIPGYPILPPSSSSSSSVSSRYGKDDNISNVPRNGGDGGSKVDTDAKLADIIRNLYEHDPLKRKSAAEVVSIIDELLISV